MDITIPPILYTDKIELHRNGSRWSLGKLCWPTRLWFDIEAWRAEREWMEKRERDLYKYGISRRIIDE